MCNLCNNEERFPLPTRRSYRRTMKKVTKRKLSSQSRININQFWNQIEEFQYRREDEIVDIETLECDREVEQVFKKDELFEEFSDEDQFYSATGSADSTYYCSATGETPSPVWFVSYPQPSPPSPMFKLPQPPSFSQSKHLLELARSFKSFTLCTAVWWKKGSEFINPNLSSKNLLT